MKPISQIYYEKSTLIWLLPAPLTEASLRVLSFQLYIHHNRSTLLPEVYSTLNFCDLMHSWFSFYHSGYTCPVFCAGFSSI